MQITHVLMDGAVRDDIRGHVVSMKDVRTVYMIMDKINEERRKEWDGQMILRGIT